ncbi:MAG: hypothetical protein ACKOQ3_04440 [Novosphingobium sp.]
MITQSDDRGTKSDWTAARPPMDPSQRLRTHGRIRPLEADQTWWERLFRR